MADQNNRRYSAIAALLTFLTVLLIFLALFFGSIRFDRALLAQSSIPEEQSDEEMFLDPELIPDAGEDYAVANDEPAPVAKGDELKGGDAPEPPAEAQTTIPQPLPAKDKLKQKEKASPSPSRTEENTREKKERDALAENMRKGFAKGSDANAGVGGVGVGIAGNAPGRRFLGCNKPEVQLRNKVVIRVEVRVDAEGHVTSAKAVSGGNAALRRACEGAARTARWSPKSGAADTPGSITFTITPK